MPRNCPWRTRRHRPRRTAAGENPPALVGTPARQTARTLDPARFRTAVADAVLRRPPGLLRARGLRPVERADPRPRLPRSRPAVADAADARRPARPQARLCRAVAPPCQHPQGARRDARAGTQDPFGLAGAAAGSASRRSVAGRAAGAGVDLRRPHPRQAERLVLGAVLGKLDAGRPLPPPARDPAQRPRHPDPVRAAGAAARHRRRRPRSRTHRAQAVARAAHAFPPHPRRGDRPGPVDPAPARRQGAGVRRGQGSDRRPGAARQVRETRQGQRGGLEKGARLRLGNRRRLFAPGGAFAVVPADPDLEPHLPRRAGPPPRPAQAERARP